MRGSGHAVMYCTVFKSCGISRLVAKLCDRVCTIGNACFLRLLRPPSYDCSQPDTLYTDRQKRCQNSDK